MDHVIDDEIGVRKHDKKAYNPNRKQRRKAKLQLQVGEIDEHDTTTFEDDKIIRDVVARAECVGGDMAVYVESTPVIHCGWRFGPEHSGSLAATTTEDDNSTGTCSCKRIDGKQRIRFYKTDCNDNHNAECKSVMTIQQFANTDSETRAQTDTHVQDHCHICKESSPMVLSQSPLCCSTR